MKKNIMIIVALSIGTITFGTYGMGYLINKLTGRFSTKNNNFSRMPNQKRACTTQAGTATNTTETGADAAKKAEAQKTSSSTKRNFCLVFAGIFTGTFGQWVAKKYFTFERNSFTQYPKNEYGEWVNMNGKDEYLNHPAQPETQTKFCQLTLHLKRPNAQKGASTWGFKKDVRSDETQYAFFTSKPVRETEKTPKK
ncbi:MAG TPA: hypothetical protein VEK38_03125 [Candidatus Bathyarchaeia archaeon]|nr:hypothetical protein [Candidatus Bathyarchaeia archaeon]